MEAKATQEKTLTGASLWERAVEFDFARPLAFSVLAVVYLVSRIPWLNLGYGTDPDAWRVALSAEHLLSDGEYLPSRLPGSPLHELATVPFVRAGWLWANLSTVFISIIGLYLFAKLVAELKLPSKGVATLAFAFTPLLWINSMTTMDYMWSITFILACYLLLMRRRFLLAGVCLGLAMGFRLTSMWATIPFLLWLWREKQLRAAVPFLGAVAMTSLIAYSPVLARYQLGMLNFYDAKVPFSGFIRLLGKETLGIAGALAVLVGLAVSLPRLTRLPRDLMSNSHVFLWMAFVVVYFVSFTRLPHEVAYLLPLFPFGFFLMARYFQRPVMVGVVAVIILAGFVDITSPGDEFNRAALTNAKIGQGLVLSNGDTMRNQREFTAELMSLDLPEHSVVLTGFIYPQLAMRYKNRLDPGILERDYDAISMLSDRGEAVDEARNIRYVWLLKYETFEELRAQGYRFYFVSDAAASNAAVFDFRPGYFGAEKVQMERETASGGKGTAKTDR